VLALGIYCALQDLRAYKELLVVCTFTLFLYFARPLSEPVCKLRLWRPLAALGLISYSLYLINQFNLRLVIQVASHLAPHAPAAVQLTLMVALQILLAAVFWYFCERPFLNRSARAVASSPAVAAA